MQLSQDPVTGQRTTQVTRFKYDGTTGDLIGVSDPRRPTSSLLAQTMKYNKWGQVTEVRDPRRSDAGIPNTLVQTNDYDASGNLTVTQDALGNVTVYTDGDPTTPADNLLPDGSPRRVKDSHGVTTHFEYDSLGQVTTVTSAEGTPQQSATTFTYRPTGEKASQTTTRSVYNPETGQTTTETLLTTYVYDEQGRLLKTISPEQQSNPAAVTGQPFYNALGKVQKRVDHHGRETSYLYDALGQLTQTTSPGGVTSQTIYDDNGRVVKTVNATTGQVSETDYDTLGRVAQSRSYVIHVPTGATLPGSETRSRSVYDDAGRVLESQEWKSGAWQTLSKSAYNVAGDVLWTEDAFGARTEYDYDAAGRTLWIKDARGHFTRFGYDRLDRVVLTERGAGSGGSPSPSGATTEVGYDALGRKVWETVREKSGGGDSVRMLAYGYDALGRLVEVTQVLDLAHWPLDPLGQNLVTRYGYDAVGNKIWQQDAEGVSRGDGSRVTRFGYDKNGRLLWRRLPGGQTEWMSYDALDGRLLTRTDFNGKGTTFHYFGLPPALGSASAEEQVAATDIRFGRLWQKRPDPSLGNDAPISFDFFTSGRDVGRKASATYGTLQTRYFYDAQGRTNGIATVSLDGSLPTRSLRYGYDEQGNKVSTNVELWAPSTAQGQTPTHPLSAFATGLGYDLADRVASVQAMAWNPATAWNPDPSTWGTAAPLASYTYNPVGSLASVVRGNGLTTSYEYNPRNELHWMAHAPTHGPPNAPGTLGEARAFLYESDLSGKRTRFFVGTDLALSSQGVPSPASGKPGTRYTYDRAGRLTREERPDGVVTVWTFDKVGNRLTQTVTLPASQGGTVTETRYRYDDNDRLLQEETFVHGTLTTRKHSAYNANGELVWTGTQTGANLAPGSVVYDSTATYAWTFEGRLSTIQTFDGVNPTGKQAWFEYDAEGNRVGVAQVTQGLDALGNGYQQASWRFFAVDTQQPYAEVVAEWEGSWQRPVNGCQTDDRLYPAGGR